MIFTIFGTMFPDTISRWFDLVETKISKRSLFFSCWGEGGDIWILFLQCFLYTRREWSVYSYRLLRQSPHFMNISTMFRIFSIIFCMRLLFRIRDDTNFRFSPKNLKGQGLNLTIIMRKPERLLPQTKKDRLAELHDICARR